MSLQSIEKSSLCYTVGPYCLSILYILVCICQSQSPSLSLPPFSPLVTISLKNSVFSLPCGLGTVLFFIPSRKSSVFVWFIFREVEK